MACSSLQSLVSVALLTVYFMVLCSSVPIHTNSTISKQTPEDCTISVDRLQSTLHDINERISTTETSRGTQAKPTSHVNKNQSDVTSLKNEEETSVTNDVSNILAADGSHGSKHVRRSERSTRWRVPDVSDSRERQKVLNYFANFQSSNSSNCHLYCSVISEHNTSLKIGNSGWNNRNVIAGCPITISLRGSHVIAECKIADHTHTSSDLYDCKQVYYTHKSASGQGHDYPVGCVNVSRSLPAKRNHAPPSYI